MTHVFYYGHTVIEDADPATFVELENGYAKDKNHTYLSGNIVEDDTEGI